MEVAETWNFNAKADAFFAVLSDPNRAEGKWRIEEFFATGEGVIGKIFLRLEKLGVAITKGKALDFGCGLGRLTQALARKFEHVTGVDVSEEMIRRATELLPPHPS